MPLSFVFLFPKKVNGLRFPPEPITCSFFVKFLGQTEQKFTLYGWTIDYANATVRSVIIIVFLVVIFFNLL